MILRSRQYMQLCTLEIAVDNSLELNETVGETGSDDEARPRFRSYGERLPRLVYFQRARVAAGQRAVRFKRRLYSAPTVLSSCRAARNSNPSQEPMFRVTHELPLPRRLFLSRATALDWIDGQHLWM
jgi:hypothetical protein